MRGDERGIHCVHVSAVFLRRRTKRPSGRPRGGDELPGEGAAAQGPLGGGARQAAQGDREGAAHGERLRRVFGRDRERATGADGSRLQPRLPFAVRRHVAL